MCAHFLLNLLNELEKRDKCKTCRVFFFRNEFNKFNNTRARLDSIYHITLGLL